MSSILSLREYSSSSSDDENTRTDDSSASDQALNGRVTLFPVCNSAPISVAPSSFLSRSVVIAPDVYASNACSQQHTYVDTALTELKFNPRYEQLFAPVAGPQPIGRTQQQMATRNSLSGYVEPAHFNAVLFEEQRRSFHQKTFFEDLHNLSGTDRRPCVPAVQNCHRSPRAPSSHSSASAANTVDTDDIPMTDPGDIQPDNTPQSDGETPVFTAPHAEPVDEDVPAEDDEAPAPVKQNACATSGKPGRKRYKNTDSSDVEGYLGPWAKYVSERTVAVPTQEEKLELDIILAKRKRRSTRNSRNSDTSALSASDALPADETAVIHIKDVCDYQGRSFMHAPHDVGVSLRSDTPPDKCFIPKACAHTWTQAHHKGIHAIRWIPRTAHLILSAGMDSKIKLWEMYRQRRLIQTYMGHSHAVRDVCFSNDGAHFISASYDRTVKVWDTEYGKCTGRFSNKKLPYCVRLNPDEDKQQLFLAGLSDKRIVCWDMRTAEIVQEYDRHLGAVNTITFIDENRRFVSTSDDKSVRVWEWDIPVDTKYIAEPSMHSMPAVTTSPNSKWLAFQSMDNKICIFTAVDRYRFHRKKTFTGHMVAGYACSCDFSPEMSYLISGDADGKLFVWNWKTTRLVRKWQAHDGVCIQCLWHPHETSKVVTAGWDGTMKLWD